MAAKPKTHLGRTKAELEAELKRLAAERDDAQRRLVERTAERDESEAQKAALAQVLGVINSSPRDLVPVFDAILERALTLCKAAFGVLYTFDGNSRHIAAHRGVPSAYAEFLSESLVEPPAPGSSGYRLVQGEDVVRIDDIRTDEDNKTGNPARLAVIELGGACSLLAAALRKDGALLGFFTIYRQEVRPFTDKQIALLQNFAAQAVIAMENARLITETREALEQQTATAEVLGVINASPGDLAPVFDAILEKAMQLCEAAFGQLAVRDGDLFRAVALRGVPTAFAEYRERNPAVGGGGPTSMGARLLRGERVVHLPDLMADEHYRTGDASRRAIVDLGGARTALLVPLLKEAIVIGTIMIYRQEVRPFSDKQIVLLQNFAAQAVIAMENARLITETREALEQQTATAEVLGVINASPGNLAPVFDAILDKAHALCGAEYGVLLTYDGERFWPVATHGHTLATPSGTRAGFRPGFGFGKLLRGDRLLHIHDMAELAAQRPDDPVPRALAEVSDIRTQLAVPLRKDDKLLGIITANRHEVRPFTNKEIALLENFAAQAMIAMENARLLGETREALEQQTATAEVLQVINSSPGDLAPVFEALLDKALALCGATYGGLSTFDGDCFHLVAGRGHPEYAAWARQRGPLRPAPGSTLARIVGGEDAVQIPDIADDELYRSGASLGRRALVEIGGFHTLLIVALRKDNILLGAIAAYRQEIRPFTDKQIALLQNFAAQAVIAMENARLLGELRQRTDEVAELNRALEARVAEQVEELGRVGRLKRFLAPQLAELIVSQGDENILESHRREIVVVFCDLRGYTAFTETAEPEEVLDFLREYHGALGPLVAEFEGTLDQFSGDGIMVFFNDPVPIPDPAERAVKMAMAMREAAADLIAASRRRGRQLGFGAGIAQGYATLGQIGFAERSGYTAIGTVCNVAARLCAEAKDGQILLSQRVAVAVEGVAEIEEMGALSLKGLTQQVVAFNAVRTAATQPALRVIEGGQESV